VLDGIGEVDAGRLLRKSRKIYARQPVTSVRQSEASNLVCIETGVLHCWIGDMRLSGSVHEDIISSQNTSQSDCTFCANVIRAKG
jgi:hypothetical protein